MRGAQWAAVLGLLVLSALFASLNAAERTTLNLGFTVLYQVSLVRLVLGAFLLGMLSMFLVGLRHDLRLRQELRRRGLLDAHGALRPSASVERPPAPWEAPAAEPSQPRAE